MHFQDAFEFFGLLVIEYRQISHGHGLDLFLRIAVADSREDEALPEEDFPPGVVNVGVPNHPITHC